MKIGIDLVDIDEFRKKRVSGGQSFLNLHFLPSELDNKTDLHLAGIYSAKEAVFKTGYLKKMVFHHIQIMNNKNGRPEVFDQNGKIIDNLQVSISHSKKTVVSIALWD